MLAPELTSAELRVVLLRLGLPLLLLVFAMDRWMSARRRKQTPVVASPDAEREMDEQDARAW